MLPATVRDGFIGLLMDTGNVSRTAAILGINRMTAYAWRDDPEYARRWDAALEIARHCLRERVVETACAMGVGEWVPIVDLLTGEPQLDDEFEPAMRLETGNVDARVLMKLMDKTMRAEDGSPVAAVQVNNHVHAGPRPAPRLVRPTAEEILDADFEELDDD